MWSVANDFDHSSSGSPFQSTSCSLTSCACAPSMSAPNSSAAVGSACVAQVAVVLGRPTSNFISPSSTIWGRARSKATKSARPSSSVDCPIWFLWGCPRQVPVTRGGQSPHAWPYEACRQVQRVLGCAKVKLVVEFRQTPPPAPCRRHSRCCPARPICRGLGESNCCWAGSPRWVLGDASPLLPPFTTL